MGRPRPLGPGPPRQGEGLVPAQTWLRLVRLPVFLLGPRSPSEPPITAELWRETAVGGEGFPGRIKVQD